MTCETPIPTTVEPGGICWWCGREMQARHAWLVRRRHVCSLECAELRLEYEGELDAICVDAMIEDARDPCRYIRHGVEPRGYNNEPREWTAV